MSKLIVEEINANTLKPRTGTSIDIEGFINTGDVYDPRKYGDIGDRTALQLAINACTNGTVYVPPYTWNITDGDLIVPENVNLKIEKGAIFNIGNGRTITISGTIEAGKWQIFAWSGSGAINLRGCKNENCYIQWWGALEGTSNDISAILLKAYQSLDVSSGSPTSRSHNIVLSSGFWRIATPFEYVPEGGWASSSYWLPSLIGEAKYGSVLYMDVGSSYDGITIGGLSGGSSRWIQGTWIRDLVVLGSADSCRHAFYLACWNSGGGVKNVVFDCGSFSSCMFLTSVENCYWDVKIGPGGNKYTTNDGFRSNYSGVEAAPVTGVGYESGGGTYNYFRVHKTFTANESFGLKLDSVWGFKIDTATIEGCGGGEIQSYYTNSQAPFIPLYSGGNTKIGHTFILTETTIIDDVYFSLNKIGTPSGLVTCSIYNAGSGTPTGSALYTAGHTEKGTDLNGGLAFSYFFSFPKITLAAGIYFVSIEYSGGDSNNYIAASEGWYGSYYGENPSTCYTWNGSTWNAQTYKIAHGINNRAAIWILNSSQGYIERMHMESPGKSFLIDNCRQIEISGAEGTIDIRRSKNIRLSGSGAMTTLLVDPYSTITLEDNLADLRSTVFEECYGFVYNSGISTNWFYYNPPNIKTNSNAHLFSNTLLERWRTSFPDGLSVPGTGTWTKCGIGLTDTTRHPLASFCGRYRDTSSVQSNWGHILPPEILEIAKGNWICWSFYMMFPAGQTFTHPIYISPTISVPAWQNGIQYNIGDGTNGGTAICVQKGISGGSTPSWGRAPYHEYTNDGNVLWLNCYAWANAQFDSSFSDGIWRRYSINAYVPTNATAANFTFQWYGQTGTYSEAYFALPTLNIGVNPLGAPGVPSIDLVTNSAIINGLFLSKDSYIPTSSSSKLYSKYSIKGDRCKNDGIITTLASGNASEWGCTVSGTNGVNSTWIEVSRVP
jgi:hypothetical protein